MQQKYGRIFKGFVLAIILLLLFTVILYLRTNKCEIIMCLPFKPSRFLSNNTEHKTTTKVPLTHLFKVTEKNKETSLVQTTTTISSSHKEEFNTNCEEWSIPEEWSEKSRPQIVTNPNLFLYPGVLWGPNNQIVGFKMSIYIAIRLNRTLVLPVFRTHSGKVLSPYRAIDVEYLCKFVSCISIKQLKQSCGTTFDVVLQSMLSKKSDIQRIEADTGLKILDSNFNFTHFEGSSNLRLQDTDAIYNISALPNEKNYKISFQPWLTSDIVSLHKAYETNAPCAVYSSAWQTVSVRLKYNVGLPLEHFSSNISSIPDDILLSAVTDAVRHPPCIVKAALKYIDDVFNGQPFVAVHWRYDEKDWGKHCKDGKKQTVCENLQNIIPIDLATGIVKVVTQEVFDKNRSSKTPMYLYIASPPSLYQFIDETFSGIQNLTSRLLRAEKPIEEFLKNNFQTCWDQYGWDYVDYIVSMVEMEIMYHSEWFLFSPISTWSTNILPLRRTNTSGKMTRKFHTSVLDVAVNESKLRIQSNNTL